MPDCKIILSDGTKVNARLNMNTFESDVEILEEVFEGKLDDVSYEVEGETVELGECNLVYCGERGGVWRFSLKPLTAAEKVAKEVEQQRADLDYIAMETGVEI